MKNSFKTAANRNFMNAVRCTAAQLKGGVVQLCHGRRFGSTSGPNVIAEMTQETFKGVIAQLKNYEHKAAGYLSIAAQNMNISLAQPALATAQPKNNMGMNQGR